tara:strand:- start:1552 stop:1848 length:297 start_codon:yes stop_codon:yes gene_type:complete
MSEIVKLDVVETEMMEMRLSGEALNVSYEQVGIQANSYGCTGCGLVWDRKWYAEQCEDRNHVSKWEQRYGGIVENNIHKNYKAYQRNARGYRKDIVNV